MNDLSHPPPSTSNGASPTAPSAASLSEAHASTSTSRPAGINTSTSLPSSAAAAPPIAIAPAIGYVDQAMLAQAAEIAAGAIDLPPALPDSMVVLSPSGDDAPTASRNEEDEDDVVDKSIFDIPQSLPICNFSATPKVPLPTKRNYIEWNSDQLKKEMGHRKVRGTRGIKKVGRARLLLADDQLRLTRMQDMAVDRDRFVDTSTTRTKHCGYRILNIVFSDKYSARVASSGDTLSRPALEGGQLTPKQKLWQDMSLDQATSKDDEICLLHDVGPDMKYMYEGIDPSIAVPHSPLKMEGIFKETLSDYAAALGRFTVSGQHESEFWNYCRGNLLVYYLRCLLQVRPNLTNFVARGFKEGTGMDTTAPANSPRAPGSEPAACARGTSTRTANPRRRGNPSGTGGTAGTGGKTGATAAELISQMRDIGNTMSQVMSGFRDQQSAQTVAEAAMYRHKTLAVMEERYNKLSLEFYRVNKLIREETEIGGDTEYHKQERNRINKKMRKLNAEMENLEKEDETDDRSSSTFGGSGVSD